MEARALQNDAHTSHSHLFRTRVANACDVCKLRKIKCSGTKPCWYCLKKGLPVEACHYTAQRDRRTRRKIGTGAGGAGVDICGSGNRNRTGIESTLVSSTSIPPGILPPGPQHEPQHQQQSGSPNEHQVQPQGQYNQQNHQPLNPGKKRKRRRSFRTITTTPREDRDDEDGDDRESQDDDNSHGENEETNGPDDTEVPRDARLVRDPQGKLIFIGDCAPLSFFQTVRRLVTSRVDENAFSDGHGNGHSTTGLDSSAVTAATTSGMVTHGTRSAGTGMPSGPPEIDISTIPAAVEAYFQVTAGLVDLFDEEDDHHHDETHTNTSKLEENITAWANSLTAGAVPADATSAVNYLVLAIGHQSVVHPHASSSSSLPPPQDRDISQSYFNYARTLAFADLTGNFGIGSLQGVQVHILIAVYMLLAHHTHTNGANGAFLFFGIAARAAYSLGIHRTEINARFGDKIKRQRERIWRSIRVVDLFLSTSMGRPPAASDVDCTVGYSTPGEDERLDLLNASVQILLVTERVVLQVYSRRKISVQLTEGISRELRGWSSRWLGRLKGVVDGQRKRSLVNGACQVLASYYYAVILVSRPFLMVELHHRLGANSSTSGATAGEDAGYGMHGNGNGNGNGFVSGRTKLADACIDAAVLMVTPVRDLIARGEMVRRAPVVVSWLFAASLVLGLGLLGGFGRVIEKHCRASIAALEYFAESDAHAAQYSMIARSLLGTALEYLERKETEERKRRTENSAKIFGLIPREDINKRVQSGEGLETAATTTVTTGIWDASGVEYRNLIFGESGSVAAAEKGHGSQHPQQQSLEHEVLSPPRLATNGNISTNYGSGSLFFGLGSGESSLPKTPEFSSLMGVSMDDADEPFGALNLFPLLDSDGIDLANLF